MFVNKINSINGSPPPPPPAFKTLTIRQGALDIITPQELANIKKAMPMFNCITKGYEVIVDGMGHYLSRERSFFLHCNGKQTIVINVNGNVTPYTFVPGLSEFFPNRRNVVRLYSEPPKGEIEDGNISYWHPGRYK